MTRGTWTTLLEDLLCGLVHAMNNRVTALSAFVELAAMDGNLIEPPVLREEITRLHHVNALVGMLATCHDEMEALEIRAVLELAVTIHSHHPRIRSTPCTIVQSGVVPPVRVPRWALLRLLLLMVDAARRAGTAGHDRGVEVRFSGDEAAVRVQIVSSEPLGADADSLAAACEGGLTYSAGVCMLQLPSLLEIRRLERRVQCS